LHGFLSAPQSKKAQQLKGWLAAEWPSLEYYCPQLSSYPGEAKKQLENLCIEHNFAGAVGSSLGGFWASYLVESGHIKRAVLINPAVSPQHRFQEFVGRKLRSYYSEDSYVLSEADISRLSDCELAIKNPSLYKVLLQTGDEVLDYRLAAERYRQADCIIEEGGNHSFEGFERYFEDIIRFITAH
jgi:predicted esterase YcpF (UPF0227 family)